MTRLDCSGFKRNLAWVGPIAFLFAFQSLAFAQKAIVTTLCAITSNPKQFQHRLVQFSAHYESDAFEYASLTDETRCSSRIAPLIPEKLDRDADLSRRIWISHPGTQDKVVSAIWEGIFQWQPNKVPMMTLQVRRIKNLTITCESCAGFNKAIDLPDDATSK